MGSVDDCPSECRLQTSEKTRKETIEIFLENLFRKSVLKKVCQPSQPKI